MNIITATEFRNNQRKHFDLAEPEPEPVYITRAGKTPIALTPVDLENNFSGEDVKSIQRGIDDIKADRGWAGLGCQSKK